MLNEGQIIFVDRCAAYADILHKSSQDLSLTIEIQGMLEDRHSLRTEVRMGAAEIDRLDQENALLELEEIVSRVRSMADLSYDMDIGEVWEYLDIWASGGNADAVELLIALKAAVARALPALETT